MAKCSKCGARIIWIKTPAGKWMPADEGLIAFRKDPDGKDYLVNQDGEVFRCTILDDGPHLLGDGPDGLARRPHWATCPEADSFRRPRGR